MTWFFFQVDRQCIFTVPIHPSYTAISIYVVGSKPQAYNPESLKLILIYPYRLSVLSVPLKLWSDNVNWNSCMRRQLTLCAWWLKQDLFVCEVWKFEKTAGA